MDSDCPFCNDPKTVQEMEDADLLDADDTCNFRILFEELARRYNNKKKECEATEKLLNDYREQLANSRVFSRS